VLLKSSEKGLQNALDRFSAACGETGTHINTKKTEVVCLSTNPMKCMLQVNGNKLQQGQKFQYLRVVFTSGARPIKKWIHGLAKQMQLFLSLVALW